MKGFAKPAEAVVHVGECVQILFKDKELGWPGVQKMMGKSDFMNSLKTYDKDGITEKMIKALDK